MAIKKREIDFKYNFKNYLSFIKRYKFYVIVIILLAIIIEGKGIFEKYLFKVITDDGAEYVGGAISLIEYKKILFIIAGIFLFISLVSAILKFIKEKILIELSTNVIADLKRRYFNHIIHLSYNFHSNHKTGSLISRIIRGGHAIDTMNDVIIFNFAPMIFQTIIILGSLIYLNFASAIVLTITSVLFISYSIVIQNKSKKDGDEANKTEDREKGFVGDIMTNIDSIKHFGKESLIKNKFKKKSEDTKIASKRFWNYFTKLQFGQSMILSIGLFFLVYFPITAFLKKEISIGSVVFIYSIYGSLVGSLFGFVHGIRNYYRAMIDFEDLFQYGKIENEIKDKPGSKEIEIKKGDIEFRDISFKYNKKKIFDEFDLKVNANEKVALVGHSGCGKTTLIRLLYRLYDPQKGRILIDGADIRNFKQESLRSELSIVPQECVLFDDTIYNNIAFSNPKASKEEIRSAIKFAQLDEIIKDFPKKEKTIVGERGVKLSGGEKQRVSIARAILANKKILVLDEATSALDSQTEHDIQTALKKLMQGRTSIIIAHRLSTIMHADKIVVIEKGKIVQMGKHNELINQKGAYRRMWNLQKGGYIK